MYILDVAAYNSFVLHRLRNPVLYQKDFNRQRIGIVWKVLRFNSLNWVSNQEKINVHKIILQGFQRVF